MGQPVPPTPGNEGAPLYQGIDPEWNDVVRYIPEDKRAEFAPVFNQKVQTFKQVQQQYEPWKDFVGSGITPDYANQALIVMEALENRPQEVFELLQKHLGLTPQQAQQVVDQHQQNQTGAEQTDFDISKHPEFQRMKQQLDAASGILLASRQEEQQKLEDAQADAALDEEIAALKQKVGGNIPEREILMRIGTFGMTAEEAYADYQESVKQVQQYRPSPLLMGGGGPIPSQPVDVTKLDNKGTKDLIVQMLEQSQTQ